MKLLDELDQLIDRLRGDAARTADESSMLLQRYIDDHDVGAFRLLRERNPIVTVGPLALVTRYDDVCEVLGAHDAFSVELYARKMEALTGPFILGLDDAALYRHDHTILRAAVRPADLPWISSFVAETAEELLDNADGRIDVVQGFADLIAHRTLGTYFGTPGPDAATFVGWTRLLFQEIFINVRDDPDLWRSSKAAAEAACAYMDGAIAERKQALADGAAPRDDVLDRLLALQGKDQPSLDDLAIRINLVGLAIGWLPTASKALSLAMEELLNRPEELAGAQRAALADDDAAVRAYVWEALRFRPQNSGLLRKCTVERTLAAGTARQETIREGVIVYAATQSAMNDEQVFSEPERFRVDRPEADYLHFGHGLHTCFGEPINRVQLPQMAKALLRRPGLRRAEGRAGKLSWNMLFPKGLTLAFDPK